MERNESNPEEEMLKLKSVAKWGELGPLWNSSLLDQAPVDNIFSTESLTNLKT